MKQKTRISTDFGSVSVSFFYDMQTAYLRVAASA
jgi:hypothetical protein